MLTRKTTIYLYFELQISEKSTKLRCLVFTSQINWLTEIWILFGRLFNTTGFWLKHLQTAFIDPCIYRILIIRNFGFEFWVDNSPVSNCFIWLFVLLKVISSFFSFWFKTKYTHISSTAVDVIIGDIRQALEEYNAAASQALTHSTEAWRKTTERNFTQYSWNITEHTRMAENISAHVEQTLTRVFSLNVNMFWCHL